LKIRRKYSKPAKTVLILIRFSIAILVLNFFFL
jgi:hypothetical protein